MDSEDMGLVDDVDRALQRIREEGSVDCLKRFLHEHRYDLGYVEKFYGAFVAKGDGWGGDVYEMFGNYFLQSRSYGSVVGVLAPWLESVKGRYSAEECMRLFGYFNRMYDGMSESTREGVCGRLLEILLDLGWVLGGNGALFESYVVCEKVCEMIALAGKFSSKSMAILYMELLCTFFIESSMLFSYANAINVLVSLDPGSIYGQCSIEDFQTICSYARIKNEGDRHRKLFCKSKLSDLSEVLANVTKRCSGMDVSPDTLVRRRFDFEMWGRYAESVGKRISVGENMDLIAFMKRNDLGFAVEGGVVCVDGFDYKTVEKKVFEIIDEYREKAEATFKPVVERRRIPGARSIAKKEQPVRPRKASRFHDRFTMPYKKMKAYSRYYMKNAGGIEDIWYERRNEEMRRVFEEEEDLLRRRREELRAYVPLVEEMGKSLSRKIEESAKKIEAPAVKAARSTHWRSEVDDGRAYRPPSVHLPRAQRAYVPPPGAFRHSPSEDSGKQDDSNPFRRNRTPRNSSWYAASKDGESEKKSD
ncbi:hypothetical protein [Encephalitozoon cuniculi GB-M1]|uniref:Uncharacterized protein n=1 Tax=Encephalitozoon cuniculi (strain GB-M1) TaxID=284813 RepID=Q8SW38_ENCCU|nr:uncharacterized protein ECU03_0850 [Encephalitozoon cuniculi GB-M1]CAD26229.1 hypothetical protein [Encephalitozoon cuniculi GB-M1]